MEESLVEQCEEANSAQGLTVEECTGCLVVGQHPQPWDAEDFSKVRRHC